MDYNSINFRNSAIDRLSQPVTSRRKAHARGIRRGVGSKTEDGGVETHRMAWVDSENKKGRPRYEVFPTITFDSGGKKRSQSYEQARSAGEVYSFRSRNRAERFAHGSWKKGADRREAMESYRKSKRGK